MPGAVFREGDTVALVTLEEEDMEFVRDGVNHPDVRTPVGQSFPTNLADERRYWEAANEDGEVVSVLVRAGDERVGVAEFDPVDRETGVAELGFWIHPDHQRGGYAREAAGLMIEYAFEELRMHKVTANAYDTNERSRALLERLGFREEGVGREDAFFGGTYHDTHYYGLLADEWDGHPPSTSA
jgi:RimJ/RimL family protein N-acetyltransferase